MTRASLDSPFGPLTLVEDEGSGIHASVRRAMAAIPLGETRPYGDIARDLGATAQACRAADLRHFDRARSSLPRGRSSLVPRQRRAPARER